MNGLPEDIKVHKAEMDLLDKGPQVVERGRLCKVSLSFFVPEGVSEEQAREFILHSLGCDSIDGENPLLEMPFDVQKLGPLTDTGLVGYTLWEAEGESAPGERRGHSVLRRPGEPLGFKYVRPDEES